MKTKKKKPTNGKLPKKKTAKKKSPKQKSKSKLKAPKKETQSVGFTVDGKFVAPTPADIKDMKERLKLALSALTEWHLLKHEDRQMEWSISDQK